MSLSLDGERRDRELVCSSCGRSYRFVTGFVYRDGDAAAIYHAQCHGHQDGNEAWIDVVIADPTAPEFSGQFTFGCRVGTAGVGLVDAPTATGGQGDYFGAKLTRSEALRHDRLGEVWEILDFVVTGDPTISTHIHGSGP